MKTIFDICRGINKKDYEKIQEIYGEKELKSELGLVVVAVTETRELINHALAEKGRSDEYVLKCEEGGYEEMCEISEKIYRHGIGYLRCAMP